MPDASSSAHVEEKPKKPHWPLWIRLVHRLIRETRKRKSKKQPEAPSDKAARRTAWATVAIAFLTLALVGVSWLQYQEVEDSSDIMDRMNRIYRTQAGELSRQAEETHDLAAAAKAQSDQTKRIADDSFTQSEAALTTAKTGQQQFEASERPWLFLTVKLHGDDLIWINHQPTLSLDMSVRNVGHSVAKDIVVWGELIPINPDKPQSLRVAEARKRQEERCFDEKLSSSTYGGMDLFPESPPMPITSGIGAPPQVVAANTISYSYPRPYTVVGFYVSGCLVYRSSFSAKKYRTFFGHALCRTPYLLPNGQLQYDIDVPDPGFSFETDANVPAKGFQLCGDDVLRNDAN
jgi:hypothetical protein